MAVPTLVELAVDGNRLALRYSETISSTLPSIGRFQVLVNGSRRSLTGSPILINGGTTILLGLSSPVFSTDSVSLSYINVNGFDRPGSGDITSISTLEKASFFRSTLPANLTGTAAQALTVASDSASLRAGETATLTFRFSRDPGASFSIGDIAASGGSLSALAVSADPKVYTATFTPTANSVDTASISIAAGSYIDIFGTGGTSGLAPALAYDTLPPTLAITSSSPMLIAGQSATITFSFSEPPSDFTAADVVTTGGSLTGLAVSTDPKVYTATFTPNADSVGTASITVAAGCYIDAAGNLGEAGNAATGGIPPSLVFDTLMPTLAITSSASSLRAGQTATITFSFSEPPSGFTASDVIPTGGSLTGFAVSADPKVYTATFTPAGNSEGSAFLFVASGSWSDLMGNAGGSASSPTLNVDTRPPTLSLSIVDPSLSDADNSTLITFSFSEAVTGFSASDVLGSGGVLSGFSGSGSFYSAIFTAQDGLATSGSVSLAAGFYSDLAGNAGGAALATVPIDTLNPTVSVSLSNQPLTGQNPSTTVSFQFSEPVNGFTLADLSVTGGILSGFSGSGSTYTATYTALNFQSAIGTISVGNGYFDAASNQGVAKLTDVALTLGGGADPNNFDNNALGTTVIRTTTGNGGNETIRGTPGNDTINGNNGDDIIYGGAGNDTLTGDPGSDTMHGGSGIDNQTGGPANDVILGGSGDDNINGGNGADIIGGGFGNDILTGGNGDDKFYFFSIYDQQDLITDFVANGDTNNQIIFDTGGPSAFTSLGSGAASTYTEAIASGFLTYSSGVLSYDADGSAGNLFSPLVIAILLGAPQLNNTRVQFQNL